MKDSACLVAAADGDLRRKREREALAQKVQELSRSEQAVRQQTRILQSILDSLSDGVVVADERGEFILFNPAARRILGLRPACTDSSTWAQAYGLYLPDMVTPYPADSLPLVRAMRGEEVNEAELFVRRPDLAEGIWVSANARPLQTDKGDMRGGVEVLRDITARKQLEAQLALAQKMESIGQLAAGIAHEINTPLQYVSDNTRFLQDAFGNLETLLKHYAHLLEASKAGFVAPDLVAEIEAAVATADVDYLTEETPRAIQQSLEGIERVTKIVRAMKEFSHPGTEEKVETDLNRAIETTMTVARNEWKYVADVVTDFDPVLPPVPCLPGDFNQVILNLIVNAAHAIMAVVGDGSRGKGTITLSTRHDGEWVEIRIRDTGTGIPEATRTKIFAPFFTTKEVGKGTGQGLAIAYAVIVKKHGGTIAFETEVGKGTTFVLRLPLAPISPPKDNPHEEAHSVR